MTKHPRTRPCWFMAVVCAAGAVAGTGAGMQTARDPVFAALARTTALMEILTCRSGWKPPWAAVLEGDPPNLTLCRDPSLAPACNQAYEGASVPP